MRGLVRSVAVAVALSLVVVGAVWLVGSHDDARPPLPSGARADRILVEKSARRMTLFQGGAVLRVYHVALGRGGPAPKRREGDNRVPEGTYSIDSRNPRSAFHLSLRISYPSAEDRAAAAARGEPPGGDIMIHGIRNGFGWIGTLHRRFDWTQGCVAVTDAEMDEIWRLVANGTLIEITP